MAPGDIAQLSVAMAILWFGCLGNTFIILVYFLEYRGKRTLQPYEVIVTLLALCSILSELDTAVWLLVYFLNLCSYVGEVLYKVTDTLITFFPKSVYWLTAWLCFIYCVIIIRVNWRFFLRLKQKISLVVNFMILGTLLLCLSISLPVISRIKFRHNSTNMCRQYYIAMDQKEISLLYTSILTLLTSFLPLVLMLVSSFGTVIFLCQHSRNMDKNITPTNISHSEAHTSVAIMLICLIALFVVCAGTALTINLQVASGQFDLAVAVILTQLIYSAGSPVILVIGTVKLRKYFKKLCSLKG
nr:PREDICTED: taste receptor type 2 member 40-like [Latimeria chalumnae]|eukprot:XP_006013982.1 PREDICTED: taste receptor type 2 member 40-like [Latimeria chalumnae]